MSACDLARLKQLEALNAQMQRIIARQTVKIDAMDLAFSSCNGVFFMRREDCALSLNVSPVAQYRLLTSL